MSAYGPQSSPALNVQIGGYPSAWQGLVPKRVRMHGDAVMAPVAHPQPGAEYDVWVGSTGCVIAILPENARRSLRHGDFSVLQWHDTRKGAIRQSKW